MIPFKIIEGRKSGRYDHFSEYSYVSCQATVTRLMGVIALKVTWRSKNDSGARYYQIIHLDYSEYGIDEYMEFECIRGEKDYNENRHEMSEAWERFKNVMGGGIISIPCDSMLRLIDSAVPLAGDDVAREYDDAENIRFRHYALMRIGLMKAALEREGVTSETCSLQEAIGITCPESLTAYEIINYFLMRIVDHDYDAALWLSDPDKLSIEKLRLCELTEPGIQTLMRSSISRDNRLEFLPDDKISTPYKVTITTLGTSGYYHSSLVIYLGYDRYHSLKVTQADVGTMLRLSEYESAILISQEEYLTVFQCDDDLLDGFDAREIGPFAASQPVLVPNGWLYTIYNRTNSHVDSREYRMGDDVYGYGLLSIGGEFVLMSNDRSANQMLENMTLLSVYYRRMKLKGRYMIATPIFHSLCHMSGVYFDDMVRPIDDE